MAHVLHENFTFWHMSKDHGSASRSWTDALKDLATVTTVEEFWHVYNHMMRPDEIGPSVGKPPADMHIFRSGIKPAWEDPANASGGKMMLRLRKPLANQAWERVVLGLVGGSFPAPGTLAAAPIPEGAGALDDAEGAPAGHLLVGAVLSVRAHDDSLALWLRSCHDEAVLGDLRDQLCALLRVPLTVEVDFKPHNKRRKGTARLPARPGQRAALREAAHEAEMERGAAGETDEAAGEGVGADDEDGVSDFSKGSSSHMGRHASGGAGSGPPTVVRRVSAPDDDGWRTVR